MFERVNKFVSGVYDDITADFLLELSISVQPRSMGLRPCDSKVVFFFKQKGDR